MNNQGLVSLLVVCLILGVSARTEQAAEEETPLFPNGPRTADFAVREDALDLAPPLPEDDLSASLPRDKRFVWGGVYFGWPRLAVQRISVPVPRLTFQQVQVPVWYVPASPTVVATKTVGVGVGTVVADASADASASTAVVTKV